MKTAPAHRHVLAQGFACDIMPFARRQPLPEYDPMSIAATRAALDVPKAYPNGLLCETFPLNWPSSVGVGPFFSQKPLEKIPSHNAWLAVESRSITTNDRGISCGNYWHLAFWPCRSRLAWTMTFNAAFWARGLALFLPKQRVAASARARFWAACSAQSATTSTSAGAKRRVTRHSFVLGSNGRAARLALFAFLPPFSPRAMARAQFQQELAHV